MAESLTGPIIVPSNLISDRKVYEHLNGTFAGQSLISIVEPYATERPETYAQAQDCFEKQKVLCQVLQQEHKTKVFRLVGFSSEMVPSRELYKELVENEIRGYLEQKVKNYLDRKLSLAKSEKTRIVGVGGLDIGQVVPDDAEAEERNAAAMWIAADMQTNFFLYQVGYALARNLPAVIDLPIGNKRLTGYSDSLSATLDLLDVEFSRGKILEEGRILFREINTPSDLSRVLERGFYAQLTTKAEFLKAEETKPELSGVEKAVSMIQEAVEVIPAYAGRIISGTGFNGDYQDFLKFNKLLRERVGEEKAGWVLGKSAVGFFGLERRLGGSD